MTTDSPARSGIRIVSFNNIPGVFGLVRQWATQAGHTIVLIVTSPGPKSRRSTGFQQIAAMAGEQNIEVLITTRLKTVATPLLRELKPDLIVSASFPWLLPPELLQTARLGAVNLHPALLPAYRGPNVARQFYDAAPSVGATLHWMDGDFDTGRILSQHSVALPRPCTPETMLGAWAPTMLAALSEGVARAIAGDPGTPQPPTGASYAAAFSESEYWLDLNEPAFRLQCKTTALNLFRSPQVTALNGLNPTQARAHIAGRAWQIERIDLVDAAPSTAQPGTVLEQLTDGLIVQTGDGVVKITANTGE
jgi:methionyl-tRNA formyltransferase